MRRPDGEGDPSPRRARQERGTHRLHVLVLAEAMSRKSDHRRNQTTTRMSACSAANRTGGAETDPSPRPTRIGAPAQKRERLSSSRPPRQSGPLRHPQAPFVSTDTADIARPRARRRLRPLPMGRRSCSRSGPRRRPPRGLCPRDRVLLRKEIPISRARRAEAGRSRWRRRPYA